MDTTIKVLAALEKLPMDRLNALIALGALVLAAFAIHVLSVLVKELKKR